MHVFTLTDANKTIEARIEYSSENPLLFSNVFLDKIQVVLQLVLQGLGNDLRMYFSWTLLLSNELDPNWVRHIMTKLI